MHASWIQPALSRVYNGHGATRASAPSKSLKVLSTQLNRATAVPHQLTF